MRALLPLLLLLPLAAGPASREPSGTPDPIVFHTAPDGDGRNPGTKEKPFATPQQARDAVRALKQKQGGLKQPVEIKLRGGTYFLREPLVLTPDDSGTKDCPITYRAEGPDAVLSGGRRLTGWKEETAAGKKLWTLDIPEVRAGKWHFHQLWVNGQRRTRARHPNSGFLEIEAVPDATPQMPYNVGQKRFQFAAGDVKRMNDLEDVDAVVLHLWVSVRLAAESIDEKQRIISFKQKSKRKLTDGPAPARYWIENALELLDAPGEWHLSRKTGRLHYWPMPGETIDKADAIAPVLPQLLRLEGKPEAKQYVEYVNFDRLNFHHAEWWPARDDPADVQAAASVPAVLHGDGVRHCTISRCRAVHASGYGLHLARGCSHCQAQNCGFEDLGAGGVRIGETTVRDDLAQQTHDIQLRHSSLHKLGRVFPQAVGVWIGQSWKNTIANNHISDLYYTGISAGWTWGYGKTLAHGNVIESNLVEKIGQGWLSDMGGVYTLGVQPGTVVRNNVFRNVAAHRYGGWGIYFDEGSTNIVAEKNLVHDTTHGGFHQHYGKDNLVRHNIFALGRDAQVRRTRLEAHNSFTFENNIVYWETGKLLDGNWSEPKAVFGGNVYWQAKKAPLRFDKLTWEQWRGKGMDGQSIIADPLFVDVAKRDFGLRAASPARALVKPIERLRVGPLPGE